MKSKVDRGDGISSMDGRTALHIACSRDDNYQVGYLLHVLKVTIVLF